MRILIITALILIKVNICGQAKDIQIKSDTINRVDSNKIPPEKLKSLIRIEELKKLIATEENKEKKAGYYFDAGVLMYEIDEYNDAVEYYSHSLDFMTLSMVYLNRALAYYQLGDYDNTLKDLNSHLKLLENYDDLNEMRIIYTTKADCFFEKKNYELAVTEFSNYLDVDQSDIEILYKRGVIYSILENYKEAIYDFSKVLNIKSTATKLQRAYAYKERGEAKSKLQDIYGAMEDLNKSIILAPLFIDSYNVRGNIYFGKKNYILAMKDYNKVLSIENNDLDALVNRAKIKIILKDKKSACIDLSRAGELGSDEAYELIKQYCN